MRRRRKAAWAVDVAACDYSDGSYLLAALACRSRWRAPARPRVGAENTWFRLVQTAHVYLSSPWRGHRPHCASTTCLRAGDRAASRARRRSPPGPQPPLVVTGSRQCPRALPAESGPAPFERCDCRRRDRCQGVNRARSVTVAQLTELRGSRTARWRVRFSTTSDRSAGSNGAGPDAVRSPVGMCWIMSSYVLTGLMPVAARVHRAKRRVQLPFTWAKRDC